MSFVFRFLCFRLVPMYITNMESTTVIFFFHYQKVLLCCPLPIWTSFLLFSCFCLLSDHICDMHQCMWGAVQLLVASCLCVIITCAENCGNIESKINKTGHCYLLCCLNIFFNCYKWQIISWTLLYCLYIFLLLTFAFILHTLFYLSPWKLLYIKIHKKLWRSFCWIEDNFYLSSCFL